MVSHEEEYTDYSCSTAIERLSRDVETILRTWHVDRGSDRHVSVHKKGPSNPSKQKNGVKTKDPEDPTSNLIRSNTIPWAIAIMTEEGRQSITIDLELALWDAPQDEVLYEDDEDSDPLVRSLRRSPFTNMVSHDLLFDNFSALFGIGQHISLAPIQPDPVPLSLTEYMGNSVLQRHDDQSTATWVLGSTLSGWLQTALNCAIASCHCCIPAFGVWGVYRPNQLLTAASQQKKSKKKLSNSQNGSTSMHAMSSPPSVSKSQSSRSNRSSAESVSHQSAGSLSLISETEDFLLGTTISTTPSPVTSTGIQVFPKWVNAIRAAKLPQVGRKFRSRASQNFWNQSFVPPVIGGCVLGGSTNATMWVSVARNEGGKQGGGLHNSIATNSRLAVWGSVLLQHCPDSTVVLSGARHVFGWFKPPKPQKSLIFGNGDEAYLRSLKEWRGQEDKDLHLDDDFASYRKHCQAAVLDLLEEAWGCRDLKAPIWGPVDDPVSSVYATATWCGKSSGSNVVEPLLSFPLRVRSRRELSKRDWIDMEESVERTILDPLSPSRFCVQTYYDRESSVSTLAANQRCLLAALIRAATLPGETLLQHLTDEELVALWDDNAGTVVAKKLAERSRVGTGTRQIVEVMDWSSIMDDMISLREAEEIVHSVMNGDLTSSFPSSPEETFIEKGLMSPFRKAAPWGRLLSILFAHMAKLRAVSSMSLVWGVFVDELRRRWDTRESIPNMQYVAGLDPHPLELYEKRCFSSIGLKANFSAFLNCSEPDPDDYHCLIGQKLQVFNLGIECIVAGEILEHEAMERFLGAGEVPASASAMPGMDDTHTSEADNHSVEPNFEESEEHGRQQERKREASRKKWPRAKENGGTPDEDQDYGPPAIDSDLEFWVMDEPGLAARIDEAGEFDFVAPPENLEDDLGLSANGGWDVPARGAADSKKNKSKSIVVEGLPDQAWEGTIMDGGSAASVTTSCSLSQQYYDAAEAGSIFSMKNGFVSLDTVVNVEDMRRRPGARCPVQGITLRGSGDQLYAPYLQRPFPLTDDLVLERRVMLAQERRSGEKKKSILQRRLDLAHRLQKPKLLSDMCSFKAANPEASIDDFTSWYGNPGSPLDDYGDDMFAEDASVSMSLKDAYHESAAKKLDKASEAMKVLMATRDFWSATWDEATAIPASEQDPLFDYSSTVEIVIDYLEQMHPANLVNQVLGVNLSSAYFALIMSAEDAIKVGLVESSFKRLRVKIDKALELLSRDATGALFRFSDNNTVDHATTTSNNHFSSENTITACEEACNALSVTETMMARAVSLLHKFPKQYDLVQDLLRLADGIPVAMTDPTGRVSFLNQIHEQQKQHSTFAAWESRPKPVLREYVLRNLDDGQPCQLSVRFGDEGAYLDRVDNEGGILMALLKSSND